MRGLRWIVAPALLIVLAISPAFAGGEQEAAGTGEDASPLIWYVPGGSGYPYNEAEQQAVEDALNELVEPAIGTTVDIRVQGKFGEYDERMPLVLASGEKMDILWTSTWSNSFLRNAYDGFYAGLDELLEEHGEGILADTRQQLEAARVEGEIRGVWSQQIAANTTSVEVNMELAEKYGWDLESVDELSDIEPFLLDVRDNEPEIIPFAPLTEVWNMVFNMYGFSHLGTGKTSAVIGARLDDPEIEIVNYLETEEYRENAELMRRWYEMGFIPQDGLTYTFDQWSQLESQGRIAFRFDNTYNPQLANVERAGVQFRLFPIGEPVTVTGNIINTLHAVHSRSQQKEKAVEFLNFLWTNEEAYNLVAWGIEGRHYEVIGENRIRPIPDSGYYTNIPWMWGNTFQSHLLPNQPADLYEEVRRLNENSVKAPWMGFVPNMAELKSETASVSAVIDQYRVPVAGGYVEPEEGIAEFQAALKQAGIDDLIAGLQAQVDEWLAAQ
jgi:putative aldouronate transport system substrate-binding protein